MEDNVVAKKQEAATKLAAVERVAHWPIQDLYDSYAIGHLSIEQLAVRLAEIEAASKHLPGIKKAVFSKVVAPHEDILSQFKKENAADLKGITLEQAEAPEFVPTQTGENWYLDNEPAKLVKIAAGL
jgi:hypothetical protein